VNWGACFSKTLLHGSYLPFFFGAFFAGFFFAMVNFLQSFGARVRKSHEVRFNPVQLSYECMRQVSREFQSTQE
jgi:hypothetical protein